MLAPSVQVGVPLALLISAAVTFAFTPVAQRLARRTNFLDHPLGYKQHRASTPYLGGLAVLAGFLLAASLFGEALDRFATLTLCGLALAVVGTVDDRVGLGIGVRLLAQVLAALALWQSGLAWTELPAEWENLALTVVWVIGLTNAFNLFDNSDGAAAAVAAASTISVALVAVVLDDTALAIFSAAVAGSCIAFLRYNLANPARIFLGDGGSMPLGLLVAGTIMALPSGGLGAAAVPAFALLAAMPILDTTLVVISRARRGNVIFSGARDHLTHRLLSRLGSVRRVALALGAAQLLLGVAALGLSQLSSEAVVVWTLVYVFVAAAVVGTLEKIHEPGWRDRREPTPLRVREERSV